MWKCNRCNHLNRDEWFACGNCGLSKKRSEISPEKVYYDEDSNEFEGSGAIGLRRLSSISWVIVIISVLILIVALFAAEDSYHGYERYSIWIVLGSIGTAYGIISIPIFKALATITEAAHLYKENISSNKEESEPKFKVGDIVIYKPLNLKLRIEEFIKTNEYICTTIEDGKVKIYFYKENELSEIN